MTRRVQFAALLAVILVIAAAGMASGTDGKPIIAGVPNTETEQTILTNTSTSGGALTLRSGADVYTLIVENTADFSGGGGFFHAATDGAALVADNIFPDGFAFAANGKAAFGNGAVVFGSTSGIAAVPAGSSSIRVQLPPPSEGTAPMDDTSHIVATLQQFRNAWVVAVTPHPATQSFTIFLSRAVFRDTRVAWFMFDSLH